MLASTRLVVLKRASLATRLIGSMSPSPDTARQALIRAFFSPAVIDIVGKLDGLWFHAAHARQAARLDWSGNNRTLTEYGVTDGSNFVADRGYTGNGVSGTGTFFLGTGIIPGNGGYKYLTDVGSAGVVVQNPNGTTNTPRFSLGFSGTGGRLNIGPSGPGANQIALRENTTASQTRTSTITAAHWYLSRFSSTAYSAFKDGASIGDFTTSVVAVAPQAGIEFVLFANGSGIGTATAGTFTCSTQSMGFIGGTLTPTEITALYAAAHAYLQGVGAE